MFPIYIAAPLRTLCIQSIAAHYERICYGCNTRSEMNFLLDMEDEEDQESVTGYKAFPGPFTKLPSSILEDIIYGINDSRGLPKQVLHQTILPQLEVKLDKKEPLCDIYCVSFKVSLFCRVTKSEANHRDTFRLISLVKSVND